MSQYAKHLYLILYPNEALVASQLSPEAFAKHYSIGSPRHFSGKVIFAEVDPKFCNEHLRVDEYLAEKELHADPGKKTKTISLNPNLDAMSYKAVQPGFWFADATSAIFYRMPTMDELHDNCCSWWRHL